MQRSVRRNRWLPSVPHGAAAAIIVSVVGVGCGGGEPQRGQASDSGWVRSIVSDVAEASVDDSDRFSMLFVEGAAPTGAKRAKYGPPLFFRAKGDPEVDGDSASFTVEILRRSEDSLSDEMTPVGEKTWNAVKVGTDWKLKDAPLP